MEGWLHEWLSLLLRWAHFIVGIAWIGASFYFNWLENHLHRRQPPAAPQSGGATSADESDPIAGDLWAVHGGGFYYLQKYRVAPDRLPEPLHWFKYEAYFTWITGFALLGVVYYWNASLYLIDPAVSSLTVPQAIGLSLAALLLSWLLYHGLCSSQLKRHPRTLAVLILAWFTALAWLLDSLLSGRAAYLHVGAAIGTVMVANVFFVIIPAQKELVAALVDGRQPDASKGENALLRSRHNNYLTLPVLFIMISNHYPSTYGGNFGGVGGWLFLLLFSLAAVGIRHWFNIRHIPGHSRWVLPVSLLLLGLMMWMTMPASRPPVSAVSPGNAATPAVPTSDDILNIVQARCTGCHSVTPSLAGFTAPPLGMAMDSLEQLHLQADRIVNAAVTTRTMPLGNLTGMTETEREQLARWYQARQTGADDTGE